MTQTGGKPEGSRRGFLASTALTALAGVALPVAGADAQVARPGKSAEVVGKEHWAIKHVDGQDVPAGGLLRPACAGVLRRLGGPRAAVGESEIGLAGCARLAASLA